MPFSQFTDDLADIKTTATSQGNLFNDATAKGWLVQFTAAGTANIWRITSGTSAGLASALPTFTTAECNSSATYTKTINNFSVMWFMQPVVIGSSDNPCHDVGRAGLGGRWAGHHRRRRRRLRRAATSPTRRAATTPSV